MDETAIKKLAEQKLGRHTHGRGAEIRALPGLLGEREEVVTLAAGEYDDRLGIIAVTDRRVIFFDKGLMRSRQEDFPFERISSVQTETKMLYGSLTIFASGNKAVIKKVEPKQRATEIGDYIRARTASGAAPTVAAAAPAASTGPEERLSRLGRMRDQGLIEEGEYQEKRREILADL